MPRDHTVRTIALNYLFNNLFYNHPNQVGDDHLPETHEWLMGDKGLSVMCYVDK